MQPDVRPIFRRARLSIQALTLPQTLAEAKLELFRMKLANLEERDRLHIIINKRNFGNRVQGSTFLLRADLRKVV